jgi:hypothetical protein
MLQSGFFTAGASGNVKLEIKEYRYASLARRSVAFSKTFLGPIGQTSTQAIRSIIHYNATFTSYCTGPRSHCIAPQVERINKDTQSHLHSQRLCLEAHLSESASPQVRVSDCVASDNTAMCTNGCKAHIQQPIRP